MEATADRAARPGVFRGALRGYAGKDRGDPEGVFPADDMTAAERTRAYRQHIMADAAEIDRRKRQYLERQRPIHHVCPQSDTRVLLDWHREPDGCMARTVGCE